MVSAPYFNSTLAPSHLIQKHRQRCLAVDLERKIGQLLIQRLARIVAQAGDLAAVLVRRS